MTKPEELTAAEKWTIKVSDLGPFAPVKKLKACLAQAPEGVDPDIIQAIKDNIQDQIDIGRCSSAGKQRVRVGGEERVTH
jgi:hypothetical protein